MTQSAPWNLNPPPMTLHGRGTLLMEEVSTLQFFKGGRGGETQGAQTATPVQQEPFKRLRAWVSAIDAVDRPGLGVSAGVFWAGRGSAVVPERGGPSGDPLGACELQAPWLSAHFKH